MAVTKPTLIKALLPLIFITLTTLTGTTANINTKGNTNIKGALIASATTTKDGKLKDNNKLNLTTKTLTTSNLNNTLYIKDKSQGVNLSSSTTSINRKNQTTNTKTKTLATIGKGNINITSTDKKDKANSQKALSQTNQDIAKTTKDIYSVKRDQGSIDATLDNRLLTKDGHKAIKEDFKRNEFLVKSVVDVATKDAFEVQDTLAHIDETQKELTIQKKMALLENGKYVKILDDKNRDKYSIKQRDEALNKYAQIYAQTYGISIDEAKSIATKKYKGLTYTNANRDSSTIYIDDNHNNGALDTAKTMGHEITHARIEQGKTRDRKDEKLNEEYANTMGSYSADGLEFSSYNYNNVKLDNSKPTHLKNRSQEDKITLSTNTDELIANIQKAKQGNGNIKPLTAEDIKTLQEQAANGNLAAYEALQDYKKGIVVEKDISDATAKALKDPRVYKETAKELGGYNDLKETIKDIKKRNYANAALAAGSIIVKPLKEAKLVKKVIAKLKGKKPGVKVELDGKTYTLKDGKPVEVVGVRVGRKGAFKQAKRDAGISQNQQPDKVYNEKYKQYKQFNTVKMTDKYGKPIKDNEGNIIWTREYQFTKEDGSKILIQDHTAGHKFNEGGKGDHGAHFNLRPSDKPRKGHIPGTKEHYPFKK